LLLIPFALFWVLLAAGLYLQELTFKSAAVFVGCCQIGATLLAGLNAPRMVAVVLYAILDLVLILKVFGGDLRVR